MQRIKNYKIVTNKSTWEALTIRFAMEYVKSLVLNGETVFIKPIYEEIEKKSQKAHKTKRRAKKSNSKKS